MGISVCFPSQHRLIQLPFNVLTGHLSIRTKPEHNYCLLPGKTILVIYRIAYTVYLATGSSIAPVIRESS